MSKKDDGDEKKGAKKANGKSDVGYCRPPKHTQWKKGQSGNRYGRPKRDQTLKAVFHEEMGRKVDIKIAGKTRRVNMLQAVMVQILVRAMQGDPKAIDKVLTLWGTYPPPEYTGPVIRVTDAEIAAMEGILAAADPRYLSKIGDLDDVDDDEDMPDDELDEDAPEEERDPQNGDAHTSEDTPAEADGEEAGGSSEPKSTQRG